MKSILNTKKESCFAWFPFNLSIKSLLLSALIITGIQTPLKAQEQDSMIKPSWWFGAAVGANFNFYRGSTHELNESFTPPVAFHDGFGIGLYLAPTIEYYRPNTMLGFMFQFGYDSRKGKFDQTLTPCDCPQDLSTKLSYLTIEPSLRLAPFKNNFYMYAGPRFAFNMDKSFKYQLQPNPEFVDQVPGPEIEGDFSNVNDMLISMQIGAGYDIFLTGKQKKTQFVLSPFVSFQPHFGQNPRSVETWNVTTIRAGAALKFGVGKKAEVKEEKEKEVVKAPVKTAPVPKSDFTVNAPENIPAKRTVRETFPLLNYVFFDIGSTEIPKRYVLLKKSEVAEFKEENVELFTPANLSGRSDRQMVVYYNMLNILGDRMVKHPTSTIKLVGSSEVSPADAREMAESVKNYLVTVFDINPSRITTEGRDKPKIPSEQPGGTDELVLLRQGDRRVSIESNSPALLMEFQSGPDAPLKPIVIVDEQEAPVESYVTFDNKGASEAFTSWSLEIKDEDGKVQNFGPYTQDLVAIPGKEILGTRPEGNYKVKMIGTTKNGQKVEKETGVHMVLWTPSTTEEVMRFSVPFNFNESTSIAMYNKYLTEVVMPKIPKGAKVIIHGHTDIIGDPAHNQKLSDARANDVKNILQKALSNAGRTDVRFEVLGLGEDTRLSPFNNKFPEERFYNRTVIIDIVPKG
jgi:outer membrane protein OmpA-like peptidoglycan-associated protein